MLLVSASRLSPRGNQLFVTFAIRLLRLSSFTRLQLSATLRQQRKVEISQLSSSPPKLFSPALLFPPNQPQLLFQTKKNLLRPPTPSSLKTEISRSPPLHLFRLFHVSEPKATTKPALSLQTEIHCSPFSLLNRNSCMLLYVAIHRELLAPGCCSHKQTEGYSSSPRNMLLCSFLPPNPEATRAAALSSSTQVSCSLPSPNREQQQPLLFLPNKAASSNTCSVPLHHVKPRQFSLPCQFEPQQSYLLDEDLPYARRRPYLLDEDSLSSTELFFTSWAPPLISKRDLLLFYAPTCALLPPLKLLQPSPNRTEPNSSLHATGSTLCSHPLFSTVETPLRAEPAAVPLLLYPT